MEDKTALTDIKIPAGIEEILCRYPLYDYRMIDSGTIPFSDRVRTVCRDYCPMYGKRWHCPPAVGPVGDCRRELLVYPQALVFSTIDEADTENLAELLSMRKQHEEITADLAADLTAAGYQIKVLSSGCIPCEKCTYPDAPCRFPDKAFPTIESNGIVFAELADNCEMELSCGSGTVTYFSIIFMLST
ncbi:MAG: DUF2284 domain-containing protein [Eubacteriaceae bacterium]|jgi:predicted metal-binding protein